MDLRAKVDNLYEILREYSLMGEDRFSDRFEYLLKELEFYKISFYRSAVWLLLDGPLYWSLVFESLRSYVLA